MRFEVVVDVRTCRPAAHSLDPTTIRLEHDVGLPHPRSVSDLIYRICTAASSTAQGGGGSFKNSKRIGDSLL